MDSLEPFERLRRYFLKYQHGFKKITKPTPNAFFNGNSSSRNKSIDTFIR